MIAVTTLQSEATTAALALIVSGFISVTMRRHVVLNLMGLSLSILGSAILICDASPGRGRWTAAILVVAASLLAPIAMTAMARWSFIGGSANREALQEAEEEDRRV